MTSDANDSRPGWTQLPAALRQALAARLGPISSVTVAQHGYTHAFAGVLDTGDDRVFVKAADVTSAAAGWYRTEAHINTLLPEGLPAPRMRWHTVMAGHEVLCFDAITGTSPVQPWQTGQLHAALRAQADIARMLQHPPAELAAATAVAPFHHDMETDYRVWRAAYAGTSHLPPGTPAWVKPRLAELAALEAALPPLAAPATGLIHYDLRADNIIIDTSGKAWVCDWNWLTTGPSWADTISLLISAHADGHPADTLYTEHPCGRSAPPQALDAMLSAYGGYLLARAAHNQRTTPRLATAKHRRGLATLAWLHRRLTPTSRRDPDHTPIRDPRGPENV